MKKSGLLVVLLGLCISSVIYAAGGVMPGNGTAGDPYLIEDLADFDAFCGDSTKWANGVYTRLETDLDLDPSLEGRKVYNQAPIAGDTDTDYSFDGTVFTGSFNGNGHIISNLTASGTYYCGLVGYIGSGGSVSNLGLENVSVTGRWYVGGLCGNNTQGAFSECYASGTVSGDEYLGGLCGYNDSGTISYCYANGSVGGNDYLGGLCGYNYDGTISNSYASGSVMGGAYSESLGGLCGANNSGSISDCYTTGSVSGVDYLGGLCGENDLGNITNCYATGTVSGIDYLGGLCGKNNSIISNCYAIGSVSGDDNIGGLCGRNYGDISNCYAAGLISGDDYAGGLCGNNSGDISNCYFYISGSPDNGYGTPLNDDQLLDTTSFIGFDFAGDSSDGAGDIWSITPDYMPRLYWQDAPGYNSPFDSISTTLSGSGTENDPFIISNYEELIEFRTNSSLRIGYYSLQNDIDLSGTTYSNAFIPQNFYGYFDGNDFTISNLSIDGSGYLGVFCSIFGSVNNLNVENCIIAATSGFYCGKLCGNNFGTISNCYATGSIRGSSWIGGLCGGNSGTISNCYATGLVSGYSSLGGLCGASSGTITNCYATGLVSGVRNSKYLGGLCGYNNSGTISNCYATGSVSGDDYLGGLCGYNLGAISNCYATGAVSGMLSSSRLGGFCGSNESGTISYCYATGAVSGYIYLGGLCGQNNSGNIYNCYFYISGGPDNGYGTPLNDAQLLDTTSFIGFDFAGDSSDGADDIWSITSGYMPRLYWQDALGFNGPLDSIETTLSGSGYLNDPFIIADLDDMIEFRTNLSLRIGHYCLQSDIDLTGITYPDAFIPENFYGYLDGNGFALLNLSINGSGYLGLFRCVSGTITNLALENYDIIASADYTGGLCGWNLGIISDCYATGSISGGYGSQYLGGLCGYNLSSVSNCYAASLVLGDEWSKYLGGLCGYNRVGTISNCYTTGSVSGERYSNYLGGLCGENENGTITNCYSSCPVTGDRYLGGLCGHNDSGTISNCYATGLVSGDFRDLGGLCGGSHLGTISNCYATGSVMGGNGSDSLGGLCGSNSSIISSCYTTGSVLGGNDSDSLGGLCGYNTGSISNCYVTGSVMGGNGSDSLGGLCGLNSGDTSNCYATGLVYGDSYVDGLFGRNYSEISSCYFYIYGGPDSGYGISLDDFQLQDIASFTGFDFAGDSSDGTEDIWSITPGYMPRLSWQSAPGFNSPLDSITTTLAGSGYINDPFIIADYDDMIEFRINPSLRIGYYSLQDNIDLSGTTYPNAFIPELFNGHFEGNGFSVSNLIIDGSDYLGLFSLVSGTITNLTIDNFYVFASGNFCGNLCGENTGTITNCYSTSTISGSSSSDILGGLCGINKGTITNCYATGSVSGGDIIGGVCGGNSGDIFNCNATGTVSGERSLGGLCGSNSGDISNCNATGSISSGSDPSFHGGLCGNNTGSITNCYATGSISGGSDSRYHGGLCGYNTGSISNCYATGSISVGRYSDYLGGLCGSNKGHITDCYATGSITCERDSGDLGGLCGNNRGGTISNCYATGSISAGVFSEYVGGLCGNNGDGTISSCYFYYYGGPDNGYGIPLNDTQLLDTTSFISFDFTGDSSDGTEDIWSITSGYMPRLYWQDAPGFNNPLESIETTLSGSGYKNDPFIISNYDDMLEFRSNISLRVGYYALKNGIDFSGITCPNAFIQGEFKGYFDGNGFSVSYLSIDGSGYLGLFSLVSGTITNLAVENFNITASGNICGGLCGENRGTISNCYATGSVSGYYSVGGLCGYNDYGTISNCYATGSVSGYYSVGGLCGYNDYGTISNCYATGTITCERDSGDLGGLCGNNRDGTISNCYFYYYGGPDNGYGIPLNDTQLLDATSFIGFDFTGDSSDGTEDIWSITLGYMPRLAWQESPGFTIPEIPGLEGIESTLEGTGSLTDPFLVFDIDDLNEFIANSALRIGYYKLKNDLDLSDMTYTEALVQEDFYGTFDGGRHIISGLNMDGEGQLGLFKNNYGRVKDLGLEYVDIKSTADYVGSLASVNYGRVTGCYSTGIINGSSDYVGGLIGYNEESGYVESCYTILNIKAGDSYDNRCNYFGGLIGYNTGNVSRCYSGGVLDTEYTYYVGGLIGYSKGNIENSYSKCDVNSYFSSVGGFLGYYSYFYVASSLVNCYSAGSVYSDISDRAGLIGYSDSALGISGCFWDKDKIELNVSQTGGNGLTTAQMQNINIFVNSGWDFSDEDGDEADWQMPEGSYPTFLWGVMPPDLTGTTVEEAEILLNDAGLRLGKISYEFSNTIPEGKIISQSSNFGSPVYIGSSIDIVIAAGGFGTKNNPYLIRNFEQFREFCSKEEYWAAGVYFKLDADIDLDPSLPGREVYSEAPIAPVATNNLMGGLYFPTPYYGHFDGDGHVIRNLTVYGEDYCALFGYTAPGSSISNLGLEDISITTTGGQAGGMVANSHSIVDNCYTTGQVSGQYRVGGFYASVDCKYPISYGDLNNYGQTTNCYSTCNVTGTRDVGGFTGFSCQTLIENCYSTGDVSGEYNAGGFVGLFYVVDNSDSFNTTPLIKNSYSIGSVEYTETGGGFVGGNYGTTIVSNCFWDIETSTQSSSDGGIGLTTAEMQDVNTFLGAGWDFVDETENGIEDAWVMDGYPKLYRNVFDINELGYLVSYWLADDCEYGSECFYFDYNDDERIDIIDFAILAGSWLEAVEVKGPPEPNPLSGYWKLDEVEGSTAFDSSGYGYDGIAYGDPGRGEGIDAGSYVFDGANDYIKIGYAGIGGSGERTIGVWIKADEDLANSEKNFHAIMSWGKAEAGKKWVFMLDANSGQLALSTYSGIVMGGPDLEDGLWHHVAVVLPAGSNNINQVKMYVDGVEIATNAGSLDAVIDSAMTEDVLIGAVDTDAATGVQSPAFFFKGEMDEVRIYNAAISEAEISEL